MAFDAGTEGARWYALIIRSGAELTLARILTAEGFRAWVPTKRATARSCRHAKRRVDLAVEVPVIRGFLFIGVDADGGADTVNWPLLWRRRGVMGVVGLCGEARTISDREMTRMVCEARARAFGASAAEPVAFGQFKPGDDVEFLSGGVDGHRFRVEDILVRADGRKVARLVGKWFGSERVFETRIDRVVKVG